MRFIPALLLAAVALAAAPPRRIVSTAPSITETLFALGAGDRVAGVTEYCRFPPEAARLPKIGGYLQPNIERVLALRPDLVVIPETPLHSRDRYALVKLRTLEVRFDSIADIHNAIRDLGAALAIPERAGALNASIRRQLDEVRRRAAGARPVKVMFVVGRNPGSLEGLITAGKASYLTEVMAIAGGVNAFADAVFSFAKVPQEEVLARNPEVIIDIGDNAHTSPLNAAQKREIVNLWQRLHTVPAVRNRRVHPVSSDIYIVPGPRVVELARELARILHPELFR